MHSLTHFLPALPGFGGARSYAPSPVWRDSYAQPVTFQPMPKKAAIKAWNRARDFERRTRQPGRQDGALGRNGLKVLEALIFDFLNYVSGRLDPAVASIARKAGISASSARRGLDKLKAAGVLNWLRRCSGSVEDGRFVLRQDTNAYAILPASQWRGYVPPQDEPPKPWPEAWGASPALPDVLTQATADRQAGGSVASVLRTLDSDPGHELAATLARLGAAVAAKEERESRSLPGLSG